MTNTRPSSRLPERNPITQQAHNRQVFWQIILPLAVGAAMALAFAVLAGLSQPAEASLWADISLIFLLVPVMFISLLFLAICAITVYGLARLIKAVPPNARLAQAFAFKMERRVRGMADALTEPVLRVQSAKAGWQALRRKEK